MRSPAVAHESRNETAKSGAAVSEVVSERHLRQPPYAGLMDRLVEMRPAKRT